MNQSQNLDDTFPHLNHLRLQDNEGRIVELTELAPNRTLMTLYSETGNPLKKEEASASIKEIANQYLARWRLVGHVLDYEIVEALAVLSDCLKYRKDHVLRAALSTMPELLDLLSKQREAG